MSLVAVVKWKPTARVCDRRDMLKAAEAAGLEIIPEDCTRWSVSDRHTVRSPRRYTDDQVRDMRQSYRNGATLREIAAPHRTNPGRIWQIILGHCYADVPGALKPSEMRAPGWRKAE